MAAANMQNTKLEFNRLFKGCGSHQVPCNLINNHSVIPNFAFCHTLAPMQKNIEFVTNLGNTITFVIKKR